MSDSHSADPPPSAAPAQPPRGGAAALLGLGVANACCLAVGGGIGWLADRWLGTSPVLTLVGIGSGIVLGIAATFVQVRRLLRD